MASVDAENWDLAHLEVGLGTAAVLVVMGVAVAVAAAGAAVAGAAAAAAAVGAAAADAAAAGAAAAVDCEHPLRRFDQIDEWMLLAERQCESAVVPGIAGVGYEEVEDGIAGVGYEEVEGGIAGVPLGTAVGHGIAVADPGIVGGLGTVEVGVGLGTAVDDLGIAEQGPGIAEGDPVGGMLDDVD